MKTEALLLASGDMNRFYKQGESNVKAGRLKDFSFAKRASSYDAGFEGKAVRKFYNLLLREIDLPPGAAVLDVGCGTGALLKRLADKSNIAGYGIDAEEKMIAEAKKKCPEMRFDISRCDSLPYGDGSFDIVIACMAYHHFDNKAGFAGEAARVIKPGGVLYIVDPRFPWVIRKALNGILRIVRMAGAFYKPQEIVASFAPFGFAGVGSACDGYAQVVKLQKSMPAAL